MVFSGKRKAVCTEKCKCSQYVQRNIGPRSFCTKLALRARSVQKSPRSDISLYRPRVRLIRSYYYMASITSGELADCHWLRKTFSDHYFPVNGPT